MLQKDTITALKWVKKLQSMNSAASGPGGNAIFLPRNSSSRLHIRSLLLLTIILGTAVFFVVSSNLRGERERMQVHMKNRADVLIWALEGSTRSMHGGSGVPSRAEDVYQLLLTEVAMQPGVEYLAICSPDGRVLAHSNPDLVGTYLYSPEAMRAWSGLEQSQARYVTREGRSIFEVVKEFTPRSPPKGWHGSWGHDQRAPSPGNERAEGFPNAEGGIHGNGRIPSPGHGSGQGDGLVAEADGLVFVGLDPAPYELWLADSTRSSAMLGAVIVLGCVGLMSLLVLVQNFRASKRHYYNARSLTLQLFESLPLGLIAVDGDGVVLIKNQQAADLLGTPAGKKMPPRRAEKLSDFLGIDWQGLLGELDKGRPIVDREMEVRLAGNEGSLAVKLPVSFSASVLNDYSGKKAGYLFILRDIKEVSQLKEQIRLGERLSALGNLAAGVAHEIRNPLSSVKGYISFLDARLADNPAADGGMRDAVRLMNDEVERLNRVISELLGVARAGELKLARSPVAEVVERALRLVAADAGAKNVKLTFRSLLNEAETEAHLDKDKLLQALLNILINAIQASPENSEVEIRLEKGGEREEELRLEIEDKGPGMSYEMQSRIFTPYFTTKPDGTGLGLTITHQIVEQHRGRLEVTSLPGQGSCFTLILPRMR